MESKQRFVVRFIVLLSLALLLSARLIYSYLADPSLFSINTIKISANYQHIPRESIEKILAHYASKSFFSISTRQLRHELLTLDWAKDAVLERVWPDVLKIKLIEKKPVAVWRKGLLTMEAELFAVNQIPNDIDLVQLDAPDSQKKEALQSYQKLSKLLKECGLNISTLALRENEAWELVLTNNVRVSLGKRDIEKRARRFCKAYPVVFANKSERIARVDLRYARGMAVEWK